MQVPGCAQRVTASTTLLDRHLAHRPGKEPAEAPGRDESRPHTGPEAKQHPARGFGRAILRLPQPAHGVGAARSPRGERHMASGSGASDLCFPDELQVPNLKRQVLPGLPRAPLCFGLAHAPPVPGPPSPPAWLGAPPQRPQGDSRRSRALSGLRSQEGVSVRAGGAPLGEGIPEGSPGLCPPDRLYHPSARSRLLAANMDSLHSKQNEERTERSNSLRFHRRPEGQVHTSATAPSPVFCAQ